MWVEIKRTQNLMTAEFWKELFEGEGIPSRLLTEPIEAMGQESAEYRVMVPEDKKHVVEEILRKL